MVHHSAPRQVVDAIRSIAGVSAKLPARALRAPAMPLQAVAVGVLNRMLELGRPESVRIT